MAVKLHFKILLIGLAVVLGFLSVKILGIYNRENVKAVQYLVPLPEVGFFDQNGDEVALADFKGQVVLVNLWATWCPPCVAELPSLDMLQAKLKKQDFKVVAISMDRQDFKTVTNFLAAREIEHLQPYWDKDRQIALKWKYDGLPSSFLIDRQGNIVRRYDGPYAWDKGAVFDEIAEVTGTR